MRCPAYDYTGNVRPMHELEEGDTIEWKRNGWTGFQWARVTALSNDARKCPIRVLPLLRADGAYKPINGERQRWISKGAVMHIYDKVTGRRKDPIPTWKL